MKLFKDFGVRALLAIIALGCYEAMLFFIVFLLRKTLTSDTVLLTFITATQAPALTALAFYFGTRSNSPPQPPQTPKTPIQGAQA